jgi:hypothetical protein
MPNPSEASGYILEEQKNTKFDLIKRVRPLSEEKYNDVLIEFDANNLNENNFNHVICDLAEILGDSGEIGEFELDIFNIKVKSLTKYENNLINVNGKKPYMEVA